MSISFVYAASTVSGVTDTVGQALQALVLTSGEHRTSNMGKKMACSGLCLCLVEDQVVKVRDGDLRGETGIDGTATGTVAIHLIGREVRVDDVLGAHARGSPDRR